MTPEEKWMARATGADDTESRIRAALRERDAAWAKAVRGNVCDECGYLVDAGRCESCAPLRALLEEAGK